MLVVPLALFCLDEAGVLLAHRVNRRVNLLIWRDVFFDCGRLDRRSAARAVDLLGDETIRVLAGSH